MKFTTLIRICFDCIKRRFCLILWISLVVYLFYDTFMFYKNGRQFFLLRQIVGLGLCVSRGTATVINLSCALILLPICKKLNLVLYWLLSRACPNLFFFWLENVKSFHMTVAITLLLSAVIHSISHMVNLWNFSRGYDYRHPELNLAHFKGENPLVMVLTLPGATGVAMLAILILMGLASMRIVRRRIYNAFWYTHRLYLPFLVLFIAHPLAGVLKEEVLATETSPSSSHTLNLTISASAEAPKFVSIKSTSWMWICIPFALYFIDLIWRFFSRNRNNVNILEVVHMAGRTISLTLSWPEHLKCRMGQYVLLQCSDVSMIEWHPFTVVKIPTKDQKTFVVWIRVKGDWTEALEKLLLERNVADISVLVDGPYYSPMESVCRSEVALCVAAGVGITPFMSLLHDMMANPQKFLPGRVHLLWIVRHEHELTWLADLANKLLSQLRDANRPDRLHIEFYVTQPKTNDFTNFVVVDENGVNHVIRDEVRTSLLTPNRRRNESMSVDDETFNVAKDYPILGCRVRRGRPVWGGVFGSWVHLYPKTHLNLYCCGPKKLVRALQSTCKHTSRTSTTKFTFVHEGFS